jgi:cytochrome o ubiquinol oxidase operon protein cyoD
MKPRITLEKRHESARYTSYIIGFVLSVAATLLAYFFVTHHVWPKDTLVYVVLGIAVVQLAIQAVFFLHIGRGSHLKLVTFAFAILVVLVLVVGSIWIMNHLNYNMMQMTPDQMQIYMHNNEGI